MIDHAKRINILRKRDIRRQWVILFAVVAAVVTAIYSSHAHAANPRLVLNILECESGLKHDARGDDGVSRGIAQFRRETFYEFAAMAIARKRWDFKRLGKPSWLNPAQQRFLLEWGLDNGYGARWTCYRDIKVGRWPNVNERGVTK